MGDKVNLDSKLRSISGDGRVNVKFVNDSDRTADVQWLDYKGNKVHYSTLKSTDTYRVNSYATHPWIAVDVENGSRMKLNNQWHFVVSMDDQRRVRQYEVSITSPDENPATEGSGAEQSLRLMNNNQRIHIEFINTSPWDVNVFRIDSNGQHVLTISLRRQERDQSTHKQRVAAFATHPFIAVDREFGYQMVLNGESRFVVSDGGHVVPGEEYKVFITPPAPPAYDQCVTSVSK